MKLLYDIAKRYFFAKKTTQAINIITWIAMAGMAIGTMALIIILSIFNGFEGLLAGMFSAFNPDYRVTPLTGKYLNLTDQQLQELRKVEGVAYAAETLEEVAYYEYGDVQKAGRIKGVDSVYASVTNFENIVTLGKYSLGDQVMDHAVMGRGLGINLGVHISDKLTRLKVYMPLRKKKNFLNQIGKAYTSRQLEPVAMYTAGNDKDVQYTITNIEAVRALLDLPRGVSAIEIKASDKHDESKLRAAIAAILGDNHKTLSRMEQDSDYLRIMNIEKLVSYLIAVLVLMVIAFNMVGALWMMVLEKKKDLSILQSMGLTSRQVGLIIFMEGMMITVIGMVVGIVFAIIFYILQVNFGIIGVPEGFIMDAYPIELKLSDFVIVSLTVLIIGALASLLPAHRASQITAYIRQE